MGCPLAYPQGSNEDDAHWDLIGDTALTDGRIEAADED
jgi:hypothetical protein